MSKFTHPLITKNTERVDAIMNIDKVKSDPDNPVLYGENDSDYYKALKNAKCCFTLELRFSNPKSNYFKKTHKFRVLLDFVMLLNNLNQTSALPYAIYLKALILK